MKKILIRFYFIVSCINSNTSENINIFSVEPVFLENVSREFKNKENLNSGPFPKERV